MTTSMRATNSATHRKIKISRGRDQKGHWRTAKTKNINVVTVQREIRMDWMRLNPPTGLDRIKVPTAAARIPVSEARRDTPNQETSGRSVTPDRKTRNTST